MHLLSGQRFHESPFGYVQKSRLDIRRCALFVLEEPLDVNDGDQLTMELHQNFGNASMTMANDSEPHDGTN